MGTMRSMILCLALATAWGCGAKDSTVVRGPEGEVVTTDNRGNVTVDDGKGGRVDIKADGDKWTAKSSDGTQVDVTKDGMTGTNEKGEKFSMGASTVSEDELGLPFYPGSEQVSGRDMKAETDGKTTVMSVRSTGDAPAKVAEFYKGKLESPTMATMGDIATLGGKLKGGSEVAISVSASGGKSEIIVTVTRNTKG